MRIDIDEFQFLITSPDGELSGATLEDNNLVQFLPDDGFPVTVLTGAHWGPADVEVRYSDQPLPADDD